MPFFRPNINTMSSMTPMAPPVDPFRVFYGLTGVTFLGFVSGFSSCLFDLNQVKECVDYAEQATMVMKQMGDHIIAWFIALVHEVFSRNPTGF